MESNPTRKHTEGKGAVKIPLAKRELAILVALLFVAFVVRLTFFPASGYVNDTATYQSWFNTAATYGPRVFYSVVGWCDYPPLNVYFFWVFGMLAKSLSLFGTSLFMYVMKFLPNLFDLATAFLIFTFVRKRLSFNTALLATSLYAFNPAVIFDAAVWGQFDAIYTFFLVLSLMLVFSSKPKLAVVAFMLGVLTKPQSIALAPLLVFLIYRKFNWKGLLTSMLVAAATVFAVIIPFEWTNPVTFLGNIYFGAYGGYPFTTINAFNFWGFGGMWQPDTQTFLFLNFYTIGWLLFAAMTAFTLYFVYKRFGVNDEMLVLFAAFVLFFSFFMLPTRIHERYLFPAMAVLALLFPFLKKIRPMYVVLTLTCLINQVYVLPFLNARTFTQAGDPVAIAVSLINSAAFLYVLTLMVMELQGKKWLSPKPRPSPVEKPS